MAYTAIYRKYRPKSFDKMVGQDHIVRTLVNQIETDKIGHAYLFCGTRGTGKTSTARIFARAINCLHPEGAEACNDCESCRSFNENRSLNIHELDAASNNSVEDIRTLIEQAHAAGAKVIISSHDFDQTPALEEMCSRLQRMEALGGDIAKLAVMPNDELDVLRLMEASLRAHRQMQIPLITMSMGSLGMLSRIGGELIHSAVTFASVGKRSAPGQPDAAEASAALAMLHETR